MAHQIFHSQLPPGSFHPSIETLIERLRAHYPDMSGFTIVSLTGRGRDFLHHLVHTRIGGLMPKIISFDDYRSRRIAEATGRTALSEEEALLRFHALLRREDGFPSVPADTQRLLSFLAAITEFSVEIKELQALDRIGPDQLDRIDRFFSILDTFRTRLAGEGLFYPPLEAGRLADLAPSDNDLFFGLPIMTPANERFFRRIPPDCFFADAPLFGPHMPAEQPEYPTALSLVRRIGVPERRTGGESLLFTELSERAALPVLLTREIGGFLQGPRSDGEQLFIVPLDERLSFYLWELVFRPLGLLVNFAPWLPFIHFAAAERLCQAVRSGKRLTEVRRDLVAELAARWTDLGEADRSAFEAGIALCEELERLRPLMTDQWAPLSEHLIASRKLRLHGRRNAPIQVVGMGDATGIPYGRALLLPMNSGIFPAPPFSGPYLNLIHLPRIYKARYEADDLALRQFLSFGREAHIAALYDQVNGEAPSPLFAFLQTEFGRKAVKRRIAPQSFRVPAEAPVLENTDEIRTRLRARAWSFSALKRFFTCPYRFLLEEIRHLTPPSCFAEEEHASRIIGDFLHRLFMELKDRPPAVQRWRESFEEQWKADKELQAKLPDAAVRKAIALSHLADIAQWEKETGRMLLFSDEVTACEVSLSAPFGAGRYRLQGRIDRLQRQGEKLLITDLKYREKPKVSARKPLIDLVDEAGGFDDRFQLLVYSYLALQTGAATPGLLDASRLFLRPRQRGDYEGSLTEEELAACEATMDRIARRLDKFIAQEGFFPDYHSDSCPYCPYKALCLTPDLYRTGGRPW